MNHTRNIICKAAKLPIRIIIVELEDSNSINIELFNSFISFNKFQNYRDLSKEVLAESFSNY